MISVTGDPESLDFGEKDVCVKQLTKLQKKELYLYNPQNQC
ncbi:hypothetical protein lbkm_2966 [Lachnospiraceae bacterium KM106-2]|nr:hypothetical protein lbkm_2966 [Lachnospiraceae bacterium KM106-2]